MSSSLDPVCPTNAEMASHPIRASISADSTLPAVLRLRNCARINGLRHTAAACDTVAENLITAALLKQAANV